jgi:hypothetical protein
MDVEPRPLTIAERSIIDALLTRTFEGVEELREQMRTARVVGRCDCGCPTIDIEPDADAPTAPLDGPLAPVEGRIAPEGNGPPGEVILFIDAGRVTSLEYVFYGDTVPAQWPSLDRLTLFEPGR